MARETETLDRIGGASVAARAGTVIVELWEDYPEDRTASYEPYKIKMTTGEALGLAEKLVSSARKSLEVALK